MKYGPNTAEVERLIGLLPTLTWEQWEKAAWSGFDQESERLLWDAIALSASRYAGQCIVVGDAIPGWAVRSPHDGVP